ncbi:hypothetical protein Tco_1387404, partial [Tanacetum coccineum]
GNPQLDLQDKEVIDSGCSRHMTWNMSYLTDYEEIDEGYVAFRGNLKGGKMTGKDEWNKNRQSFVQLQALVDGKKVIIIESTVRRDLQLEDAEGIDCLPNATIFKQLILMGSKTTAWVATTATSLDAEQDSGNINKTQSKATLNEPSSIGTSLGSGPRCQETMGDTIAQTRFENVSKTSNDSLLARVNTPQSDEDSLKLKELLELCTNLQNRVIDMEKTKTTQAQEITSLKRRVKRLEKKGESRTHRLKILYKVGLSRRVESSGEEGLGEEDASKQGRKINDIDADEGIILVDETAENQGRFNDEEMFDAGVLDDEEVFAEQEVAAKDLTVDEVTLAQALAALKSIKPKAKGIVFREPDESTTTTIPITSIPIPSKVQDKGKGIMVEPEKPMKKKDQISLDEELAFKLQAKEEERLTREKAQQIEEVNIAWDDVHAKIEVDYQLAQRLQAQEQEELTDEEKARLFVQFLEERRKHFAAKKAKEKRNKPPTRAQ